MMKLFFNGAPAETASTLASESSSGLDVDTQSTIDTSLLGSGFVRRSVLNNVRCKHVEAEDAILINVTAERVVAPKGSIIYNVATTAAEGLVLLPGDVRAGVFQADGTQIVISSHTDIDGGNQISLTCP